MTGGARSQADARLLAELVAGATRKDAAEAAGVSEATVYRRLREPDFLAELESRQGELVRNGALAFAVDVAESREVLRQIRDDPDVPASVRVTAADRLISRGLAYVELSAAVRLDERIARIEARLGLTPVEDVAA
jgi:hypothetical protein